MSGTGNLEALIAARDFEAEGGQCVIERAIEWYCLRLGGGSNPCANAVFNAGESDSPAPTANGLAGGKQRFDPEAVNAEHLATEKDYSLSTQL